jgi:hypothetical protein
MQQLLGGEHEQGGAAHDCLRVKMSEQMCDCGYFSEEVYSAEKGSTSQSRAAQDCLGA